MSKITWNPQIKLILSDVDETAADLYLPATGPMIGELNSLLEQGVCLFFITGQGLSGIQTRITDKLSKNLRKKVLMAHCSGAEVWGFSETGDLLSSPFYSLYDKTLNLEQKKLLRKLVEQVLHEFKLRTFETMPVLKFKELTKGDPFSIMYDDRGPQITLEVVNAADLEPEQVKRMEVEVPITHGAYDLRIPIVERADELFIKNNVPVTSRLGGQFAIDFAIKGVSKETAVKFVLESEKVQKHLELTKDISSRSDYLEIWGDRFSEIRGGTDRHMCEAVNPTVRAIDFREEDPSEFSKSYNIVVWDGVKHLHEGLLEYLQSRSESNH